jgi:broad specificity phosphatase PhoE
VRKLILVRHSAPEIVPDLPASQWRLSDVGRRRCRKLAEQLAAHNPSVIVTSLEPKALETGRLVTDTLGIPLETAADLHEHDRSNVQFLGNRGQFQAQVASLFEHPGTLVFGCETADQAHQRFAHGIANVIEQHPSGNLAVVTHGTVLTLFVTRATGLDPIPFWKRLGLPSFVVLSLPELHLLEVEEAIQT